MTFKKMMIPIFFFFVLFVSASLSHAIYIPQIIGYEGRLTDLSGTPVANTPTQFTFKIWDCESGGTTGDTKCTSVETITPDSNGVFSTVIAVAPSVFNGDDRWLGVAIGTDSEMTPRIRIASAPYAYFALNGQAPSFTPPSASFTAAAGAGDTQVGGTVTSTNLTWSVSPGSDSVTSMSITGTNGYSNTPGSNSGTVSDSTHSYQYDNKPSYTFTVNFVTSSPISYTRSVGFHYVKYYGSCATLPPLSDPNLAAMTSVTADTRTLAQVSVVLSGHPYYVYPQSLGTTDTETGFTVGGLTVNGWIQATQSLTHGTATVPYYIYYHPNVVYGSRTLKVD